MFRQYYAGRWFAPRNNPLRVGPIAVGALYRLPEYLNHGRPVRWQVLAFLNGVCAATHFNPATRRWEDRVISGRSDCALIRRLADGAVHEVAVRSLIAVDDETPDMGRPSLPDVARWHRGFQTRQAA
ncbi:hypothetical protein GOB83_12625 [Acetobacter fabarum]|uniref:hypothetical protein n=1 Tax=Acetobacter TaxID=434 RepID=UPI0004703385|nr:MULTISPECIES: hypothetical protein [Acetobacter]NHO43011.1 hypothetical protein [Acetobacter fabarum]